MQTNFSCFLKFNIISDYMLEDKIQKGHVSLKYLTSLSIQKGKFERFSVFLTKMEIGMSQAYQGNKSMPLLL